MTHNSSKYFEKVAGQWDDLRTGYFTEEVRKTAINKAYLRPEMVVADVGSGTGFMAAGLAPLVARVHVIDGSAAMLDVARKNLEMYQNINYHHAEGLSIPLPDGSMEVVFANMYLHHCPDPLAAIKEMVRILRPGGRLVITDMDSHPYTWLKEEMADEWLGFERDQIRGWFKEVDLVNVIVDCTGQSCCAKSENKSLESDQQNAEISVFVATGTRRIKMQETVKETYGELAESGLSCGCSTPSKSSSDESKSSCCSSSQTAIPDTGNFAKYYTPDEKSTVTADAANFSLGCGNPTAMANIKKGEVAVDIGSGGGLDSFLAARQVGSSGKVIGVDMTPSMLERAREAAVKAGLDNVEFRFGKAESLPVDDSSVDVIISNCVINLCEDKDIVFREAFRALKNGGRMEISDIVTDNPFPAYARHLKTDWSSCVTGSLPESEYLDLIAQAGFQKIKTERSQPYGTLDGATVYSLRVSAIKEPAGVNI
jgi:ubiquinone/menaquinone biosynthesis C-methylase UbiE